MSRPGGSGHSTRKRSPEDRVKPAPPAVTNDPTAPAEFDEPDPPAHLDEVGREMWAALWALGGPTGVDSPRADGPVIDRYCTLTQVRLELLETLTREGWTAEGSKGQLIQHPAARILRDIEADMLRLENLLGLNPVARFSLQGLALGIEEQQSKLEEFLAR